MNLDILISILPFAFALHNLEEVFGMEKWTKSVPTYIHSPVTTRQFSVAVILFTFLGFLVAFCKTLYQTEEQYLMVITAFSGMLLLNVFFPHLIATIYLKKYAPGVISGVIFNLPLTGIILWKITKSNILSVQQTIASVIIGGIVGIVLAFLFLQIGKIVDKKIA